MKSAFSEKYFKESFEKLEKEFLSWQRERAFMSDIKAGQIFKNGHGEEGVVVGIEVDIHSVEPILRKINKDGFIGQSSMSTYKAVFTGAYYMNDNIPSPHLKLSWLSRLAKHIKGSPYTVREDAVITHGTISSKQLGK